MAVKTITIDTEAYDILLKQKKGKESFSKVIKRRLRPAKTASGLLDNLSGMRISEKSLDNIEKVVDDRRKDVPEVPDME